jgi:hypothetical protein
MCRIARSGLRPARRQIDAEQRADGVAAHERKIAAMGADKVAGDGETQPRAAGAARSGA